MERKLEIQKVTFTSVMAALAVVFGIINKYVPGLNLEMPQGGSIFGFPMIPLIFIGLILGVRFGVIGGMIYGLTSLILDGGLYHWASLFTDYLIAFGVLGVAGFFKKGLYDWKVMILAVFTAGVLRYLSHAIGGAIIFAEFAPEGMNPWFYSFIIYNAPYMLTSTIITATISFMLLPMMRQLAIDHSLVKPLTNNDL